MGRRTTFKTVKLSLADLLGAEYMEAVVAARAALTGGPERALRPLAREQVDFFPAALHRRLSELLGRVGDGVVRPLRRTPAGGSSAAFIAATKTGMAPLAGLGCYRVAEDGRLHFLSKSEHYHAVVGHAFPGYRLIDNARRLGIPNATHNNTRGYITRRLEEELVRTANGLGRGDRSGVASVLRSRRAGVLNRVLNLETGSLAAEAGLKLMLARFYRPQDDGGPQSRCTMYNIAIGGPGPRPRFAGRIPVLAVIGDDAGNPQANYHGTTVIAQLTRGMWPALADGLARHGLLKVAAVRPNNLADLELLFRRFHRGRFRLAGFVHELVMMNYGGRRLTGRFVRAIASLCRRHNVPVMVDEIQSCLWSPKLFMFREYGIRPDILAVGKGFPGGEYPASRVLFSSALDCLPQFGALVTNGQEELASLAYLITMRWAEENAPVTAAVGEDYEARLGELVRRFPQHLAEAQGRRHMGSLRFHDAGRANAFVKRLVQGGLDISVQTYKADCPPIALTKLPLIAGFEAVDMVVSRMEGALRQL